MEALVSSKVAIGFEFLLQEFSLFLFYKSVGLSRLFTGFVCGTCLPAPSPPPLCCAHMCTLKSSVVAKRSPDS